MTRTIPEEYIGASFSDDVKQNIKLTMTFAKAVGEAQDNPASNLVVSGYNAAMCLSMVAMGAADNTREEMAQAILGVSGNQLAETVKRIKALNDTILDANKDSITLKTANATWVDNSLPLNYNFAADLRDNFDADISNEDFSAPETVDKINQWASDNTNELITSIKEELSADDVMVLASALYVKAPWTEKFDEALTEDKEFTKDDGSVYTTPTMLQMYEEGAATYLETDDYEAVALTYGEKDLEKNIHPTMRLVMLRPKDANISARDLLSSQANGKLPAWVEPYAFEPAEGMLEMPRMDMKDKHDLKAPLEAMGIKDAFDGSKANFRPMTKEAAQLVISDATQDIVFKTNEEGSEAAAVTQVTMALECAMPQTKYFNISFDRSFVMAMQDMKTGAILFAGAVNEPNEDMTPVNKRTCGNEQLPTEVVVCPRLDDNGDLTFS